MVVITRADKYRTNYRLNYWVGRALAVSIGVWDMGHDPYDGTDAADVLDKLGT